MPINFNNADLLSYNHISDFLGDNILRYKVTKDYTVEGNVLDLTNPSGVSGILSGIKVLELSATDWQHFILNGIDLGSGIVNSLSFSESNDVRQKRYSISFQVFDSGNFNNFAQNAPYSGIDYTNFRYIDELTETINYNRTFENNTYTHDINIKVLSSNRSGSIGLCKSIATNLFTSNNIFNTLGQYYSLSGKKAIYSEEYDELNASCSFGKEVRFFNNTSGNYTINKTYNYQRGADGVALVTERGEILALVEPYIDVLSSAYNYEKTFSYNNCSQVYSAYNLEDSFPLKPMVLVQGTSTNQFERSLSYEATYTNNKNTQFFYYWDYTHDCSLSDKGLIQSSENGEIVGAGDIIVEKFEAAKTAYSLVSPDIENRTETSYDRFRAFNSDFTNTDIYLITKTETYRPYNGTIAYQWVYNNDQNMIANNPLFTRAQVVLTEGYRIPVSQSFNIPNIGEIEQVSEVAEVAEKGVEVTINAKRAASINDCLTYAKSLAAPYAGDYLTNVVYNYSPYTNQFGLNVQWGKIYEP